MGYERYHTDLAWNTFSFSAEERLVLLKICHDIDLARANGERLCTTLKRVAFGTEIKEKKVVKILEDMAGVYMITMDADPDNIRLRPGGHCWQLNDDPLPDDEPMPMHAAHSSIN